MVRMRGWICKVTGNTDYLKTVRTCGCLTPVKTRMYFHLVAVWFYKLAVSVPRANKWFLPCVSPVWFIYFIVFPMANSPSGVAAKSPCLERQWLEPKGKTPDWCSTPQGINFTFSVTFPKPNSAPSLLFSCHLHLNLVPNLLRFTCL